MRHPNRRGGPDQQTRNAQPGKERHGQGSGTAPLYRSAPSPASFHKWPHSSAVPGIAAAACEAASHTLAVTRGVASRCACPLGGCATVWGLPCEAASHTLAVTRGVASRCACFLDGCATVWGLPCEAASHTLAVTRVVASRCACPLGGCATVWGLPCEAASHTLAVTRGVASRCACFLGGCATVWGLPCEAASHTLAVTRGVASRCACFLGGCATVWGLPCEAASHARVCSTDCSEKKGAWMGWATARGTWGHWAGILRHPPHVVGTRATGKGLMGGTLGPPGHGKSTCAPCTAT